MKELYKEIKPDYQFGFSPKSRRFKREKYEDSEYAERFFCKKINENKIIEIDEEQYDEIESRDEDELDKHLYEVIKIEWRIFGPKKDKIGPFNIVEDMSCYNFNMKQIEYAFENGFNLYSIVNPEEGCRFIE